eukprot:TRINITY_DN8833_c0_g1_i5.p1 TRINITY_DN8833_c0_g1~~TRINITY_DN8833_c0_g1_i5.p1  ORF type:complete len:546 (+),score=92.51 TRINITY_DN8833_c0_g1_i5:147-1640(+)
MTDALRRIRKAASAEQRTLCVTGVVGTLIDVLNNPHFTEEIYAEAAWILADLFHASNLCCQEALHVEAAKALARRIMVDSSVGIQTPAQLHCLWCCANLAVTSSALRDSVLSTGVMDYLAKAFDAGSIFNVIENPEYNKGYTGIVLEDYSYLLRFCLFQGRKERCTDSVFRVLAGILDNAHRISRETMRNCLAGISRCMHTDFSGVNGDVLKTLVNALAAEVGNAQREDAFLKDCCRAVNVFSGVREDEDEKVALLYLDIIDSIPLAMVAVEFLRKCIKSISSHEPLLRKLQLLYHKLARKPDVSSQIEAGNLARSAKYQNLNYFGNDVVYISSPQFDEQFEFYRSLLLQHVSSSLQVSEVIQLICQFSTESYRLHQYIDALDLTEKWCAAEIVEIEAPNRIRVHYSGWGVSSDEWFQIPCWKISPAFTFTKVELSLGTESEADVSSDVPSHVLSCQLLNLHSMEQAQKLRAACQDNLQCTINCARWMNRKNLQEHL